MRKGIIIEVYRGWEISFYPDEDCFCAYSDRFDYESKDRPSFITVKKDIDDYIKANEKFKPVLVETTSSRLHDVKPTKIIGIRKDGRFVREGKNGKPEQVSSYESKDYFVVDEKNDSIFQELKELNEKLLQTRKEIQETEDRLLKVTLEDIKNSYNGLYD